MSQKPGSGIRIAMTAPADSRRRVSAVAATKARKRCAGWMLAEPIRTAAAAPNSVVTTKVVAVARYPNRRLSRPTMIVRRPIGSMLMGQYQTLLKSVGSAWPHPEVGGLDRRPHPAWPRQLSFEARFFRLAHPKSTTGRPLCLLMLQDLIALPARLSSSARHTSVSVPQLGEVFGYSRGTAFGRDGDCIRPWTGPAHPLATARHSRRD